MHDFNKTRPTYYSNLPDKISSIIGDDFIAKEVIEVVGLNFANDNSYLPLTPNPPIFPRMGLNAGLSEYNVFSFCSHMVVVGFTAMPTDIILNSLGSHASGNLFRQHRFTDGAISLVTAGVVKPAGNEYYCGTTAVTYGHGARFWFVFPAGATISVTLGGATYELFPGLYIYSKLLGGLQTAAKFSLQSWDGDYRFGTICNSSNGSGYLHAILAFPYATCEKNCHVWRNNSTFPVTSKVLFSTFVLMSQSYETSMLGSFTFEGVKLSNSQGSSGALPNITIL